MTEKTGIDDVEATLWRWSGWKADQRAVDAVLEVIERYVRAKSEAAGIRQPSVVLAGAQHGAEDILTQARNEAAQILQSARDEAGQIAEAACSEAAALLNVPTYDVEKTRRCVKCKGVKPIARYSRDKKSRAGRKAQCKDCENAGRRDRESRKRQERDSVTTGVHQ